MTRRVPEWWPDLALGVAVAAFGVWEVNDRTPWFDAIAGGVLPRRTGDGGRSGPVPQVARGRAGTGLAQLCFPGPDRARRDARPAGGDGRVLRLRPLRTHGGRVAQRSLDPRGSRHRDHLRHPQRTRHPRLAGRCRPDCRRLLLRPADAGPRAERPCAAGDSLAGRADAADQRAGADLPRGAAHGRGGAVAGRGDRPPARGAGSDGPRRPRRGRSLARGDPGPGRVGAVHQGLRHPGPQEDHGEHRDVGPLVAAGRPPGADHGHGPAAQRGDRRPGQPDRGGAFRRLRGGLQ